MNSEYYPLQKLKLFSDKDGYKNVTETVENLKSKIKDSVLTESDVNNWGY